METMLSLEGHEFQLLGLQRSGTAVYRGSGVYARIGDRAVIEPDYQQHLLMEAAKYPVAPILSRGEYNGQEYFLEKALGAQSFKARFAADMESHGVISQSAFSDFLDLLKRLATAQLKSAEGVWSAADFAGGIRLGVLTREIPLFREVLEKRFMEAYERLKEMPRVIVHGDCNPSNMYEDGIIDLEDSFMGPFGYDIATALASVAWSPDTKNFEFHAQYRFSPAQKELFFSTFDKLTKKAKVPEFTQLYNDLAFCRAVWLCTGMHEWPRLQQWRYEKLIETYLS